MSSQIDQLRHVYWHSQSADAASMLFMNDAMTRFEIEVSNQAGVRVTARQLARDDGIVISRLIDDFSDAPNDEHPISTLVSRIAEDLTILSRLVVYCPDAPGLQEMARRQKGQKFVPWGVAVGRYAFVFARTIEQVVWHEVLHTFGAEECYDPEQPSDESSACSTSNCLMQFAPRLTSCGDGFPICGRVLEEILSGLGRT